MQDQRDAVHLELQATVKRLRTGVRASCGDDSSQYEMVGGTRMRESETAAGRTPTPASKMQSLPETEGSFFFRDE